MKHETNFIYLILLLIIEIYDFMILDFMIHQVFFENYNLFIIHLGTVHLLPKSNHIENGQKDGWIRHESTLDTVKSQF